MKKIRIAVVGNCQARPIAGLLKNFNENIEITTTAIVHLLKDEEKEKYWRNFESADFIIGQNINDKYPCGFVRTSNLKKHFSSKYLEIVNLYYRGYNPDIQYLRIPTLGTIRGPMGDYHNTIILNSWKNENSIEETIQKINDFALNESLFRNIHVESLQELKRREENFNVKIAEFIENHKSNTKLFFTMNHPTLTLLIEYVKRQMKALGIPIISNQNVIREPLNQFRFPINIYSQKKLNINFKNDNRFFGLDFNMKNLDYKILGKREYSLHELISSYFDVYEKYSLKQFEKP